MRIRPVHDSELPRLQDIERAAGHCFRDVGMPEIADDEPPALEVLAGRLRAGLAWVAADPAAADVPVAYLIADHVDGDLHVEQVSVHPAYARRGIGRSLLEHLADRAAADGVPALTLTTFRDVPWNGPYYARCGFLTLDDGAVGPGLRAVREEEARLGLDRWPRVCMRRPVPRPASLAVAATPSRQG
ncbi:GNAT family N-acetyltransferase [Streptomyces silvensis]|uniref:GCN5 family acetyltransferase n=1 Tax=Streptomyces silvensis TaxID=1765722 RepID=A0A0W7X7Z4_9ACTN|nr:GNAT family N-acetyltransferase [Streptomyces silvensis]KUF19029.1 GCN5 family acetyltransferase [Streptomyces silvensis]